MWKCKLCEDTVCYTTYICDDCRVIRHLINIYSKESVLKVLKRCLVIEKFERTKRIVSPLTVADGSSLGDETYDKN